jgi:hypothetical protein
MIFTKTLTSWRNLELLEGENLQSFSARALNDAARWVEIVSLNNLVYPWVTDDPAVAAAGNVAIWGDFLVIPANNDATQQNYNQESVFLSDMRLREGRLDALDGDIRIVTGIENLTHSIQLRLRADHKDLFFHPQFGSRIRELLGDKNNFAALLLSREYARSAIMQDNRVSSISRMDVILEGDTIFIHIEAIAISGNTFTLKESF